MLHLSLILVMCAVSIVLTLFYSHSASFQVPLNASTISVIRYINIGFSFFTCIAFIVIVSVEAIKQEEQLKAALHQKEVLLAELFHRVKNNLAIVTSLLNLKKNATRSEEAQVVLEDCRNLIFSMALVHTKIYNSNSIDILNFKDYLNDLLPELINSIGGEQRVEFTLNAPPLKLVLPQAIPCGLIINELITNAFKYAQVPGQKLKIVLTLAEQDKTVHVEVADNGPGKIETASQKTSLGMDLIKSLAGQLEGEYAFSNNNGLQFNMQFRK